MNLIHVHNGTYYTSEEMFASGYGACCECGAPQLREAIKKCARCHKPYIVIRSKFVPARINENAQPLNSRGAKEMAVERLVKLIHAELQKPGILHLTVCPHSTYIKIYPSKSYEVGGKLESIVFS